MCLFFSDCFYIFCLSLIFSTLIMRSPGVIFLMFFLLSVCWSSRLCGFIVLENLENFLPLLFLVTPLSSSSCTLIICILDHLLSYSLMILCSCFSTFFLFYWSVTLMFHVDVWELSKYCPFAATYNVCLRSLCSEYLGMVRFASWMLKILTSSEIYTLLGSNKLYSYVLNFTSFP